MILERLDLDALERELHRSGCAPVRENGSLEAICPRCRAALVARKHEGGGVELACAECDLEDLGHYMRIRAGKTPTGGAAAVSPLAVRRADADRVRPFRWAWQHRVVLGYLNLLVGAEGVGKGTFLAWLIARLTRGDLPGDLHGVPGRVLFIGDEDGFDNVVTPRLIAAGADLDNVLDLPPGDHGALDLRRDAGALKQLIGDEGIQVVVFDQLLDNLGVTVDDWRAKQVREAIAPARRIAADLDIAMLAALHTNKSRTGSFRDKVSGTQAFNALSRSSLLLAEHPDDAEKRVLVRGKGNYSRKPPSIEFRIDSRVLDLNGYRIEVGAIAELGDSTVTVEQALGQSAEPLTKAELGRRLLADELADGAWHSRESVMQTLDEAGIGDREARRLATTMGVEKRRSDGFPSHTMWRLPGALARGGSPDSPTSRTSRSTTDRGSATSASPVDRQQHAAVLSVEEETELELQAELLEEDQT